jgi:hypothetical protein
MEMRSRRANPSIHHHPAARGGHKIGVRALPGKAFVRHTGRPVHGARGRGDPVVRQRPQRPPPLLAEPRRARSPASMGKGFTFSLSHQRRGLESVPIEKCR